MTKKEARKLVIEQAQADMRMALEFGADWMELDAGAPRSDADVQRVKDAIAWFAGGSIAVRNAGKR